LSSKGQCLEVFVFGFSL
jgi:hypothetical protein